MKTEDNIIIPVGGVVNLFTASGLSVGTATRLTMISDLPIRVYVDATKPAVDSGFVPLESKGDNISFKDSIAGCWVECPYGAEVNFSENFTDDSQGGSGSGATTFDALSDTPSSKTGDAGKILAVSADGSKIEYITPGSSSGANGYRDGGIIESTSDPKTMATNVYYVTEKFVGAPTLPGGDYVGKIIIQDGIDTTNGKLITYYTKDGLYTLQKYTGGWDSAWNEPNIYLVSFDIAADWGKQTEFMTVGDVVTLSAVNQLPPQADVGVVTWTVEPRGATQNPTASFVGNKMTILTEGVCYIVGTSDSGVKSIWSTQFNRAGIGGSGDGTGGNAAPPPDVSISDLAARINGIQQEIDAIKAAEAGGGITPINPSPEAFDPTTEILHGGFTDGIGEAITYSNALAGKPITITKVESQAQYAALSMTNAEATHVSGIKVDGGLPSKWDSHKATIDGTEHTIFISPYKFTKSPITLEVIWS